MVIKRQVILYMWALFPHNKFMKVKVGLTFLRLFFFFTQNLAPPFFLVQDWTLPEVCTSAEPIVGSDGRVVQLAVQGLTTFYVVNVDSPLYRLLHFDTPKKATPMYLASLPKQRLFLSFDSTTGVYFFILFTKLPIEEVGYWVDTKTWDVYGPTLMYKFENPLVISKWGLLCKVYFFFFIKKHYYFQPICPMERSLCLANGRWMYSTPSTARWSSRLTTRTHGRSSSLCARTTISSSPRAHRRLRRLSSFAASMLQSRLQRMHQQESNRRRLT